MPTWNLLADHYGKIPHNELVTIAKVDCTKETPLCAKQNIRAYPTSTCSSSRLGHSMDYN
ncbi:unnamed protein product [Porites lobata]|uniref:Thioredoxin domain-containing protein n=1 Tax=Porites lobata TaxID=104759 RepID=A0ABN8S818_9CNID|nr:unnamed protein product [Porites lobata]